MFMFDIPDVEMIFTWLLAGISDLWPWLLAVIVLCIVWIPVLVSIWREDGHSELS